MLLYRENYEYLAEQRMHSLASISYCYVKLYNLKSFKTCVLFKCYHLGIKVLHTVENGIDRSLLLELYAKC